MKKTTLAIIFSTMALITGCALTTATGQKIDENGLSSIVKGKTTKAELISKLGSPNSRTVMGDGNEMLFWSYSSMKFSMLPFGNKGNISEYSSFSATLNKQGVVQETHFLESNSGGPAAKVGVDIN
ncbi:hypothetical protein [Propionivibrio sp.]|uniref:hypothetical protein n=1 Tax=Propionivibrio sp. TaxID=2212460 RepID=UPI003BF2F477